MSATTLPQENCPCCGQPLTIYQPWKAIMAECRNPDCNPDEPLHSRYLITDELHILLAMTDADIAYIQASRGRTFSETPLRENYRTA